MAKEASVEDLQKEKAALEKQLKEIYETMERDYPHIVHPGREQPGPEYGEYLKLEEKAQDIEEKIKAIGELIKKSGKK